MNTKKINSIKHFGTWEIILSSILFFCSFIILIQETFYPQNALGAFMAIIFFLFICYFLTIFFIAGILTLKLKSTGREINLVFFVGFLLFSFINVIVFPLLWITILISIFSIIYLLKKDVKENFIIKNKNKFFLSGFFIGIILLILGPIIILSIFWIRTYMESLGIF